MKKTLFTIAFVFAFSVGLIAQPANKKATEIADKPAAAAVDQALVELAKAAVAAHGGDKLRALKSLVIKGQADMTVMGQPLQSAFSIAFSGDKYFFELVNPVQAFKQVYNGKNTYTSMTGFYLPPVASVGFPVLAHVGDEGYVISALGGGKKSGKGFRVTTPEGYYTDFYVDEKTKQIKSYESSYDLGGGRTATTSVTLDAFENVDGILAPKKFSQRFDLASITAYANFQAKTILINPPIEDSAFAMPK